MKKYIAALFLLGLSFLTSCGSNSQSQTTAWNQTNGNGTQVTAGNSTTTQNQQWNWGANTTTRAS